jgi:hypothetical protein
MDTDNLVKILWDYLLMKHQLIKADCILVLGSHDTRVAERGAQLFLDGWAPFLIFSGGLGRLTDRIWTRPEAEIFAEIAVQMGVPKEKILLEDQSTNTGENITFTKKLLENKGLRFNKFIVVQKPYMERRAYTTVKKRWPEIEFVVTSPRMDFDEYCSGFADNAVITKEEIISVIVGDLQRLDVYGKRGYQIPQEIPENVWEAFESLVKLGYTRHLVE